MSRIVVEDVSITKISDLKRGYFRLNIAPFSKAAKVKPGQFVHVQIPGCGVYFRRAFSIYNFNAADGSIEILFKVVGRGTACLAKCRRGDRLGIVGPLGNTFRFPLKKETPVLIAGGVGFPPMYLLAVHMIEKGFEGERIVFLYGGNTKDDLVDISRIRKLGVELILTTMDGSYGQKGLITEPLKRIIDDRCGKVRLYACGPEGMLQAVDTLACDNDVPGQMSLEAPMPCGVGICLGCVRPLREGGYTRVCRDGPVYNFGEVLL